MPEIYNATTRSMNNILHSLSRWVARQFIFWWESPDGQPNVGDHLGRSLVESILLLNDIELSEKLTSTHRLLSIGSILHYAKNGDCIWGTGVHGKKTRREHNFKQLDVRAVRGPITRDFLLSLGIDCPEIYGDPALLTPIFFRKDILSSPSSTRKDFIVIPHMHESSDKFRKYADRITSPSCRPVNFIRDILTADFVISSSLHGIILAEAYGIPSIYLNSNNGEPFSKYEDYYRGTDRSSFHFGTSVEDCLKLGGNHAFNIEFVQNRLLTSFPLDLWRASPLRDPIVLPRMIN